VRAGGLGIRVFEGEGVRLSLALVLAQVKFACLPDPSVLSLASAFPIPR
jgi:hypothetical protein